MTSPTSFPSSAERQVALASAKYLFQRIRGQLGNKFIEMFSSDMPTALEEWSLGLYGFRQHEIDRGLAKCAKRIFPPTLGEFAQFCRPALDPQYAWLEASDGLKARDRGETGEWSHPAVYRAAMAMSFDFRRGSFQSLRVQWERTLSKEFEKGWGEPVPPVPERVEHRPTYTKPPASVHAQLASLKLKIRNKQ
jgi:hypothetical protein